jgi:PAS domain S-box-containing protein
VGKGRPDSALGLTGAQRRADVQYAVSRVLGEAATVEQAVRQLLPALGNALGWDYAGLWLPDDTGTSLVCADTWTIANPAVEAFADASREWKFEPGHGLPGKCWAANEAMWLSAVQPEPQLPRVQFARAANLFGGLAFPITNRDGVAGVVECFTRERETVTPELLRLTESIGRQIGQFLQRRAAEEQLEANEARYSAIANWALDAIVVIDEQGNVLEFNPAAERMFGYSREQAIGREMAAMLIPQQFRDAHRAGLRHHRESAESSILERRLELRACHRDGSEFPVELTITRMRAGDRWTFLGFIRDITERQRSERERDALMVSEREARDAAVAANAMKDEFLAALSHELRTPLNAILGWTSMLMKGAVEPERFLKIAATVHRNADAQRQLVDDMLDISAFLAGRMRLQVEELTLDQPVARAWEVVRPAAEGKHVSVNIAVPPIRVRGDAMRLQQVFWNLLGNAVKFTPRDGRVTVSARVENAIALIDVTDNGVGIDPGFLPHVFDRFRQGRDSRSLGGLGLGLAIVKQIVEAHGGTVAVQSGGAGQGTSFSITIAVD